MVISARIQGFVGCEMHLKNPCRISRFISSRVNGKWSRFKFWNTDSSWSKLYIFTWVCRLTSKLTKTGLPTKHYCPLFSIGGFWVLGPTWSHPSLLKSNHFEPKAIMAPKCVWRQKVQCIICRGLSSWHLNKFWDRNKTAMQKKLLTPRQLPQARQVGAKRKGEKDILYIHMLNPKITYSNWKGKSSEPIFWVPHEKCLKSPSPDIQGIIYRIYSNIHCLLTGHKHHDKMPLFTTHVWGDHLPAGC